MRGSTAFSALLAMSLAVAGAIFPAGAGEVTSDSLLNAQTDGGEWLMYGRDYRNNRFSPLTALSPVNVAQLKPVFAYSAGGKFAGSGRTSAWRALQLRRHSFGGRRTWSRRSSRACHVGIVDFSRGQRVAAQPRIAGRRGPTGGSAPRDGGDAHDHPLPADPGHPRHGLGRLGGLHLEPENRAVRRLGGRGRANARRRRRAARRQADRGGRGRRGASVIQNLTGAERRTALADPRACSRSSAWPWRPRQRRSDGRSRLHRA